MDARRNIPLMVKRRSKPSGVVARIMRRSLPPSFIAVLALLLATASKASADAPGKPINLWNAFDASLLNLTLHWNAGAGSAPADYRVEYRLDPTGEWMPSPGAVDMAGPSSTSPLPPDRYEAIEIDTRVVAIGDGKLESEPSDPLHIVIPPTPWVPSERFVVASSAGTLLADHDALVAKGLDTFPDGLMSVVPTDTPGMYDFYANQGNASDGIGGSLGTGFGHTRGTLADPFATVIATRGPIANLIAPVDYVGGGAVWRDPATGALVMLYHREIYTRDANGMTTGAFWSSIGAAVSTDGGSTFVDAGEVLTPDIELLSPNRGSSGNGPGDLSTIVRDGWLYAYYNDNLEDGSMVLAVARTSVAELAALANGGPAPVFWKYRDGSFCEPGLGGAPSAIASGFNPSVIYSAYSDEFIMVATGYTGSTNSMLTVMTSPDGIQWSAPENLYAQLAPFRIYNTLLGDTVSPEGNRVATTPNLRVLAVDFPSSSDFWSANSVRVIEIADAGAAHPCPSDLDHDGAVTNADLSLILLDFGAAGGPSDLDGDGEVGTGDVSVCLLDFGSCG